MGVILGSGVVPIALCITWSKANKWGCIIGSITGFCAGLLAWLVTTSTLYAGVINVTVRLLFPQSSTKGLCSLCFCFKTTGGERLLSYLRRFDISVDMSLVSLLAVVLLGVTAYTDRLFVDRKFSYARW